MKKIILFLSIILMLSGCSTGGTAESSVNSEEVPETESEVSVQKDTGELLESTFMKLWKSDTVDIDVTMTVEGKEKTDEKQVYKYRIAGDKKNKTAMLEMKESNGNKEHYIVNDSKIYDINDSEKTYNVLEYKKSIDSFIRAYTLDMNMGMSESLKIADSGTADFDKQKELDFEKYNVVVSGDSNEKITVTYYFKDGKPYAEVMQSDRGKTTFIFKTVSDTLKDKKIFEVSKDYNN